MVDAAELATALLDGVRRDGLVYVARMPAWPLRWGYATADSTSTVTDDLCLEGGRPFASLIVTHTAN